VHRFSKPRVHFKLPRHIKVAVFLKAEDKRELIIRNAGIVGLDRASSPMIKIYYYPLRSVQRICHLRAKIEKWQLFCRCLTVLNLHSQDIGEDTNSRMHANECWACKGTVPV
jgi:hypothetical protein